MNGLSFLRGCVAVVALMATIDSASSQQKIAVGQSSNSFAGTGPRLAKELGLFEKHGLDATVTPLDNSGIGIAALISGSLNFSAGGPTDVVIAKSRGQDLVALCSIYRGYPGVMVLAKSAVDKVGVSPTAPVAQRAKALDGLVIATPSATSIYTYGPKPLAESNGATIRFTYMAQPAMVAAIEAGAVQGSVSAAPFYLPSITSGKAIVWISGPKGEFPPQFTPVIAQTLNAFASYVKANPDIAKKACAVFEELTVAFKDRPNDVKAAIGRIYPDLKPADIDTMFAGDGVGYVSKPVTTDELTREIAFLKASGSDVKTDGLDLNSMIWKP